MRNTTMHHNDIDSPQAGAHRFQFSVRALLVATALLAVACSGISVAPGWGLLVILWLVTVGLPAALTTIVIYGRGYLRTFAIGAMFPAAIISVICIVSLWGTTYMMIRYHDSPRQPILLFVSLGVFFAFSIPLNAGVGLLAVWIRRMVEPRRQRPQPESTPQQHRPPSDSSSD